jgi:RND family efflux transporter MFP subunit
MTARHNQPGRVGQASRLSLIVRVTQAVLVAVVSGFTFSSAVWAEDLVESSGITEPIYDVTLSPAVAGLVSAWHFKEGDFVKQDEVVLELDSRVEVLEVERRKLAMENRRTDWEALQTLFKKSSISVKKEDLDKAETEYKIAVVEHQMAAEVLRRRKITAPEAGYVVELIRDVGEACDAYQPLVRLADPRQCYFVSNVEAKAAGRLKLDQEVKLLIESSGEPVTFKGKVIFLSPVVDPASGLRKVKVLFDNSDRKINPGVAGKMKFQSE